MLPYHSNEPEFVRIRGFGATLEPRYIFRADSLD
jgi:hypothetical protein